MRFRKFIVMLRNEVIDEVYFTIECDAEYVRNSLINHDGYSNQIKVMRLQ